ncbi:MAG: FHA domain-containing protein, partial [Cyanobacteria bacterium]|nr:FHA domain-containing protein [Cyanobacteriota bacterium]
MDKPDLKAFAMPSIKLNGKKKVPVVVMLEQGGTAAGNKTDAEIPIPAGLAAMTAGDKDHQTQPPVNAWQKAQNHDDDKRYPARIFHLVDCSSSMGQRADHSATTWQSKLALVQETIERMANKLPEGIRHILIPYTDGVDSSLLGDFDTAEKLVKAVQKLQSHSGTVIETPIAEALEQIRKEPYTAEGIRYRNLINLVSDGQNGGEDDLVYEQAAKFQAHNATAFNLGVGTGYNEFLMAQVLEQAGTGATAHIPQKGKGAVDVFGELLPNYVTEMISAPYFPVLAFNQWFDTVVNLNPSIRPVKEDPDSELYRYKAAVGYQHKGFAVGFIDEDKLNNARVHSILRESADADIIDTKELTIKAFDSLGLSPQDARLIRNAPLEAIKMQILQERNPQAIRDFLQENPDIDIAFQMRLEDIAKRLEEYNERGDEDASRTMMSDQSVSMSLGGLLQDMGNILPGETKQGLGIDGYTIAHGGSSSSHRNSAMKEVEAPAEIAEEIDTDALALHFEKISGNGLFAKGHQETATDFLIREDISLVLGRHPNCDIGLKNVKVSRYHCKLSLRNGELFIEDVASQNGTYVNGHLVP